MKSGSKFAVIGAAVSQLWRWLAGGCFSVDRFRKGPGWTATPSALRYENRYPLLSLIPSRYLADRATRGVCDTLGATYHSRNLSPEIWFKYAEGRYEACGNLRRAARGRID